MNILIIGSGGREHAMAWKIAASPKVTHIYVAPGNGGTASEAKTSNISIAATDCAALLLFASENHIDLTIVGPEAPLAAGIVDQFTAAGLACFGPTQGASQLESSKQFCKDFLKRHQIPSAQYGCFDNITDALAYIAGQSFPQVIKADGLAAGKGVVIADNAKMAEKTIRDMLSGSRHGDAGKRIIIEDFLVGEEASFIAIVDGQTVMPLATSQDHKALANGDTGPNTGGMGAYSPAPVVTNALTSLIMTQIMQPTVEAMAREGHEYKGFLYAGLMIDSQQQCRVLEFNCRLGDPETQPLLMRLRSDFTELCLAANEKRLHNVELEWDPRPALGVVMAAGGYPNTYQQGQTIYGLPQSKLNGQKVFHAGTMLEDQTLKTAGGRVLCATAIGDNIEAAQARAYALVAKIHWDNMYYRTDIGHKAIERMDDIR